MGCAGSFGTAATPIPAQRQPGEHTRGTWTAGAVPGSSWGAEDAPHRGDEGFSGCSEDPTGAGTALTSWPPVPSSAGSSLPAFAAVVDQDQHAQGDEDVCRDDPCHRQRVQLLAVGAHCRDERGEMLRAQVLLTWHRVMGKGQAGREGESPKISSRALPTQSGNGLGSTTSTHGSVGVSECKEFSKL